MKKLINTFVHFWIYTKRLLHKFSFVFLLMCVTFAVPLFSAVVSDGGSVVKIALYNEACDASADIIQNLTEHKSIIEYMVYDSRKGATEAVKSGTADAAWIFDEKFEENMAKYIRGESIKPFVTVIEREENISMKLAREKLFGAIYPHMSYLIYEDFVRSEILDNEKVISERLRDFYRDEIQDMSLIEIKMIGSDDAVDLQSVNMLTAPIRGLLSMMVMLCGFASVLYFIYERERGQYVCLPHRSCITPGVATCFSACMLSGASALISILGGGMSVGFGREVFCMAAYVWASASLCTLLAVLFRRSAIFAGVIPLLIIVMLVLCPVFFNLKVLPALRYALPPYHYLMSVYNIEHIWYMGLYGVCGFGIAYATDKF